LEWGSEAESVLAFEMAGLFHGEDSPDLLPTDVHVQGIGLYVEENASRAESTELADSFEGCGTVRDDDMDLAKRLKTTNQLFPAGRIEFNGSIFRESPDNLSLGGVELLGQQHGHLIRIFQDECPDVFSGCHELPLVSFRVAGRLPGASPDGRRITVGGGLREGKR